MVAARVEVVGNRVRLSGPQEGSLPLDAEARGRLAGWVRTYRAVVARGGRRPEDPQAVLTVGRDLFAWLDAAGWASAWRDAAAPRALEIGSAARPSDDEVLLTDLPWEVLADASGFLAADPIQPFTVWRRIGPAGPPVGADHRDLSLLFMAAAPRGGGARLAFEAEEAGILAATRRLPLGLTVEETGCLTFLRERLALGGSPEALHVSCHGGLTGDAPVLQLESETGDPVLVAPGELATAWGATPPRLVFLSACHTAESSVDFADSYARTLARAVPAVVGWDGAVGDREAREFAECFYEELARYEAPAFAAAVARRALLTGSGDDPGRSRYWHLARLWLGQGGGDPVIARSLASRPLPRDVGTRAFLDVKGNRVPVAGADTFVGRRRESQQVLRALRDDDSPGVLLHGMGRLGKSSLAARVAGRLPELRTVVVYGDYDPQRVFEQVCAALPPDGREATRTTWLPGIERNPATLADAVEALLDGPFRDAPVLLVVDDLEQVLRPPGVTETRARVRADFGWAAAVVAVLTAFARHRGRSRLLVTSRYDFTAVDSSGHDAAAGLVRVPLTPFDPENRMLQWRAAERRSPRDRVGGGAAPDLLDRVLSAARGNPGLQDTLSRPLLAGDATTAQSALDTLEHHLAGHEAAATDEPGVTALLEQLTLWVYVDAVTEGERALLGASVVLGTERDLATAGLGVVPLPPGALDAVGRELGLRDAHGSLDRLVGLGLLDDYQDDVVGPGWEGLAVNSLTAPLLAGAIGSAGRSRVAAAALGPLRAAWGGDEGTWPKDARAIVAARVALLAGDTADAQNAALAALNYLHDTLREASASTLALTLGTAAIESAHARGEGRIDLVLVRRLCETAAQLGDRDGEQALLTIGLSSPGEAGDTKARADLRSHEATILSRENPERALTILHDVLPVYQRLGDIRSEAITRGQIADIHYDRGDLDEALRIRTDEELPVYQRLGDIRAVAITRGKIADIHYDRSDLDEALRIRTDEELPVYQRLGDIRSEAITRGQIADIHYRRDDLDEALRTLTEIIPIFQRLGDIRAVAITRGKIADIHYRRGDLDEALRIRTDEELPVYQRLGDIREEAIVLYKIAIASIHAKPQDREAIMGALRRSFVLGAQLQAPDVVSVVGMTLAQQLAAPETREEALTVLGHAEAAFRTLGNSQGVTQCEALRGQLGGAPT